MNPSPDFDIDYAKGAQAELFVADLRRALLQGRVEVKSDWRSDQTGNIYVEGECYYPRNGWRQTGIGNPNTAPLWVYVLGTSGIGIVFTREALRRVVVDDRFARKSQARWGSHPTRGWLIHLSALFSPRARR